MLCPCIVPHLLFKIMILTSRYGHDLLRLTKNCWQAHCHILKCIASAKSTKTAGEILSAKSSTRTSTTLLSFSLRHTNTHTHIIWFDNLNFMYFIYYFNLGTMWLNLCFKCYRNALASHLWMYLSLMGIFSFSSQKSDTNSGHSLHRTDTPRI